MKTIVGLVSIVVCASVHAQVATQSDRLHPKNGTEFNANGFGITSAIGDGVIAIGNDWDDNAGQFAGAIHLFDQASGDEIGKLFPSDDRASIGFGRNGIVIEGGSLYAGHTSSVHFDENGAVYVFDLASQTQTMKLFPSDLDPNTFNANSFGESIAVADGVIAASFVEDNNFVGAVYLFDATTGEEIRKITPQDGQTNDIFGTSIAMNEGLLAIGSNSNPNGLNNSGSISVYSVDTGDLLHQMVPDDNRENDGFGSGLGIAIEDGVVMTGSFFFNEPGAVYFFDALSGDQLSKFTPDDVVNGDDFGRNLSAVNGRVAVSAYGIDSGSGDSGAVYILDIAQRTQIAKVTPEDGQPFNTFGLSLAMNEDTLVVGSGATAETNFAGTAYAFDLSFACSRADLDADGMLTYFDVSVFVSSFLASDPVADFNDDGAFDFFDVSEFLDIYNMGCP